MHHYVLSQRVWSNCLTFILWREPALVRWVAANISHKIHSLNHQGHVFPTAGTVCRREGWEDITPIDPFKTSQLSRPDHSGTFRQGGSFTMSIFYCAALILCWSPLCVAQRDPHGHKVTSDPTVTGQTIQVSFHAFNCLYVYKQILSYVFLRSPHPSPPCTVLCGWHVRFPPWRSGEQQRARKRRLTSVWNLRIIWSFIQIALGRTCSGDQQKPGLPDRR